MTLQELKDMLPTHSTIDVDKLYVELMQLPKRELVLRVIHLTMCVESLGNVIEELGVVMLGVADKLNRSLGVSGRVHW